ncbi:Nucleic-acid-binding protein from transposon X-element [Eumeta japonica]|uniref:Nucleic-acid-binding protein from transposon X-element n=1 Tax=Eumeta variegata TaxID=151549 RepID=A0A4C1VXU0_EUMVA|nr:Nucleic-acid-binding protein from transposon X-element [Eumeta japonica]
MEPEGKHRNSIMKQRILAVFGLVEIVLRCTLTMNDFQGLMMQLEGSDNGAGSLGAPSSDPEVNRVSRLAITSRPPECAPPPRTPPTRAPPLPAAAARTPPTLASPTHVPPPAAATCGPRSARRDPRVPFGPALLPAQLPAADPRSRYRAPAKWFRHRTNSASSGPVGASGSKKLSFKEMKNMFFRFVVEQGYVIPEEAKQLLEPINDNFHSREPSPSLSVCSGKRSSSAMSSNYSSEQSDDHSDDTIKGMDDETGNSFVVYNKKRRNPKRRAVRRHAEQTDITSNSIPMETEQIPVASAIARESSGSPKNTDSVASTSPKQPHLERNHHHRSTSGTRPDGIQSRANARDCISNMYKAQNTANGINFLLNSTDDFRKINKYLINNNIPFHTFALEEERKSKAVIKGILTEIETDDIKHDLEQQGYSVHAVHRMHRRDGSLLNMVLAILDKSEKAKDIFKNLSKICGLSGIRAEAPYSRGMPGQCHRCQIYGHTAANCYA